jgi:hypothetical protein
MLVIAGVWAAGRRKVLSMDDFRAKQGASHAWRYATQHPLTTMGMWRPPAPLLWEQVVP